MKIHIKPAVPAEHMDRNRLQDTHILQKLQATEKGLKKPTNMKPVFLDSACVAVKKLQDPHNFPT